MKYLVSAAGQELEVEVDGDRVVVGSVEHRATLAVIPGTPLRQLLVDGRASGLGVDSEGRGRWILSSYGERWDVEVLDERTHHIRGLAGSRGHRSGPSALKAPMPGLVVRLHVEPGQKIAPGSRLVVLEAMKMENELRATGSAVVRTVLVRPGEAVEKGQVLIEFESGP